MLLDPAVMHRESTGTAQAVPGRSGQGSGIAQLGSSPAFV